MNGSFTLSGSNDEKNYTDIARFTSYSCFSWYDININSNYKYYRIQSDLPADIGEIQFYDSKSNKLELNAISENAKLIIDESNTVPEKIDYTNSSYFDELYFAKSAYEYTHNLEANEWVHPPLGKLIQSIPIHFMGMTPFSYRMMGNIAGILMIFVIYVFGKSIFKSRKYAFLAGIIMTFDCFHFAQTRMGTVDSFLVLFMMISSLFMFRYLVLGEKSTLRSKLINISLCGLFFGLSICTKWSGLYFGLGLAIMFFAKMIYDYFYAKKDIFKQYLTIIPTCIAFFIVIPIIIYILSYLLFPNVAYYKENSISGIIAQTQEMYRYHADLQAEHSSSSPWYTWPIMLKPIWYYVSYAGEGLKGIIYGIGNPAIWWLGVLALVYTLISSFTKKNKEDIFIIILFLTTWLPYMFIGRIMFIYHYFPATPFMMLAVVSLIKYLTERTNQKWIPLVYMIIVIIFFVIFYPIVSGLVVPTSYINSLKWFSTWSF